MSAVKIRDTRQRQGQTLKKLIDPPHPNIGITEIKRSIAFSYLNQNDYYLTSPAYFALTGRRGLWVYKGENQNILFCLHPNVEDQFLIFPSMSKEGWNDIGDLVNTLESQNTRLVICRVPESEVKTALINLQRRCPEFLFLDKNEDILDYTYPCHTISTHKVSEAVGRKIKNFRKETTKIDNNSVTVESFHPVKHKLDYIHINNTWNNSVQLADDHFDFYNFFIDRVFNQSNCQGLTYFINGEPTGIFIWEMPFQENLPANSISALTNRKINGFSEFMFRHTCSHLYKNKISLLNLGGSEKPGLDFFKRKMRPVSSISLKTIVCHRRKLIHKAA